MSTAWSVFELIALHDAAAAIDARDQRFGLADVGCLDILIDQHLVDPQAPTPLRTPAQFLLMRTLPAVLRVCTWLDSRRGRLVTGYG